MAVSPESIQKIVRYPWEPKPSTEGVSEKEEPLEDSLVEAESYEDQNKNMIHELAEAEESPKLEVEENANENIQPVEAVVPAVLELKVDKIDDQTPEKKNVQVEEVNDDLSAQVPTATPETLPETPDENMEKIISLSKVIEEGKEKFQQATDSEKEKIMESILPGIIEACEKIKE